MKIKEGEKLPVADFFYLDDNNVVQKIDTNSLFKDGKIITKGKHQELLTSSEAYKNFYEKNLDMYTFSVDQIKQFESI